jgi:hypothetical protein
MTAFVEKFALEVATTLAVGAVTGFLCGLSATPARRSSACPHCGGAPQDGGRLRRAV